MNRRHFCMSLGGVAATSVLPLRAIAAGEMQCIFERSAEAFGTTVRLVVQHRSESVATEGMAEALKEVQLIENLMSIYRSESQVSRLNCDGVLANPHPYLVEILRAAAGYSATTNSAFDITVQPLWQLYSSARGRNHLPTQNQLGAVNTRIGHENVEVSRDQLRLLNGAQITLNGIAQGFATDRVKRILLDHGINDALVDIGELACIGVKADNKPWKTGIQHPREQDAFVSVASITNRCLATSGDYEATFTDDFHAHHIFDPRTGSSPSELSSVSVLASTATEADALSTALLVMGVERGSRFLRGKEEVDAMFIRKDGRIMATQGFPQG